VGRAAAVGDEHRVAGWALAGVLVVPAATPADAVAAYRRLPDDVVLVLLTEQAEAAVAASGLAAASGPLRVVLPP
jgi:vacuolar-type H+-ATPase subunit F/Vma7